MTKKATENNIKNMGKISRKNKKAKKMLLAEARKAKKEKAGNLEKAIGELRRGIFVTKEEKNVIDKHFNAPKFIYNRIDKNKDIYSLFPLQ